MAVSVFRGSEGDDENHEMQFSSCLLYAKRTWPDESEEHQQLRAEAIYEVSKIFFKNIIPSIVTKHLAFGNN